MIIKGASVLRDKAVIYLIDRCDYGVPEWAGVGVMNRVAGEGVATFLVAPLTAAEASQVYLACKEVVSIPELSADLSGWARIYARSILFFKLCRVLYDFSHEYSELVVHTHGLVAGFWGRWAAWLVGNCHTIHTVYRFGFAAPIKAYQWWYEYVLEYVTSWVTSEYICVNQKDRALGIRLFPFFAKRCAVIKPAVDWQEFFMPQPSSVHKIPATPIVIGTILDNGASQENTLYAFLRLMHFLHQKGVPVRGEIIGNDAWRTAIAYWLLERDMAGQVRILGWQAQTAPLIRTWHVFVHASTHEGHLAQLVQARLSWVPVVVYDVGGSDEIIKHEKNGLVVECGNEDALAKAVYRVLVDRALYERLASHEENFNEHNEAAVCLRHVKLYRNIAGE